MKKPLLQLLVGPPGSGKSTYSKALFYAKGLHTTYINQDTQGKEHMSKFLSAIADRRDIIVDRMNFNKEQRLRYLGPAVTNGYETEIIILHQPYDECMMRMSKRTDHQTIKTKESAMGALKTFFTMYERPEDNEADKVTRIFPDGDKPKAIVCDLDGTLCDLEERRAHVRGEGKKNWKAFFEDIPKDKLIQHCADILMRFKEDHKIVFCSGRPKDYEQTTSAWLFEKLPQIKESYLFMRPSGDFRDDNIVKEILLDFEILTRFTPYFILDDRDQVVQMWRKRGYPCLQMAEGNF